MEQIEPLLRELAAALNTTVENVWTVLVSTTRVKGVVDAIFGLALIAVMFPLSRAVSVAAEIAWYNPRSEDGEEAAAGAVIVCILVGSFLGLLLLSGLVIPGLHDALVPEAAALDRLLKIVGI